MLTEHPITREKVRGFIVVVSKDKNKKLKDSNRKNTFKYERKQSSCSHRPYFSGEEALKTMKELDRRGFDTIAYTEANGVEDNINLEEMKSLYD